MYSVRAWREAKTWRAWLLLLPSIMQVCNGQREKKGLMYKSDRYRDMPIESDPRQLQRCAAHAAK